MSKKFDTNPLDPEFPEKVKEAPTAVLPDEAETREIHKTTPTEEHTGARTQRFNETNFGAYNSPYNGQNVPANFQAANLHADKNKSSSRKVAKVGLPENILTALPYLPITLGLVAGLLELLFVPKSEAKVRFHAAQGLAAHVAILIISAILGTIGNITRVASTANDIFWLVTTIMLIIFAVKAWKGKPVHIEWVDDLTDWLEDKIKPRN